VAAIRCLPPPLSSGPSRWGAAVACKLRNDSCNWVCGHQTAHYSCMKPARALFAAEAVPCPVIREAQIRGQGRATRLARQHHALRARDLDPVRVKGSQQALAQLARGGPL